MFKCFSEANKAKHFSISALHNPWCALQEGTELMKWGEQEILMLVSLFSSFSVTSPLWSSLTHSLKHIFRRSSKSSARFTITMTPAYTLAFTILPQLDTRSNHWTWWPWRSSTARSGLLYHSHVCVVLCSHRIWPTTVNLSTRVGEVFLRDWTHLVTAYLLKCTICDFCELLPLIADLHEPFWAATKESLSVCQSNWAL